MSKTNAKRQHPALRGGLIAAESKNIKADLIRIFGVAYEPRIDIALEIICSRLIAELEAVYPHHGDDRVVLDEVLSLLVKFFTPTP